MDQRKRGLYPVRDLCATDDCPNDARWIPASHVTTRRSEDLRYYCVECCDRIHNERFESSDD